MSAHTPGPWTCDVVIDGRANFADAKIQPEYVINRSGVGSPIIPRLEAAANADLIAAAPDLLHFVRVFAEVPTEGEVPGHWSDKAAMDRMILVARTLVAKAEGR